MHEECAKPVKRTNVCIGPPQNCSRATNTLGEGEASGLEE